MKVFEEPQFANMLYDCLQVRKHNNLSDWAYYLMLQKLVDGFYGKDTNEVLNGKEKRPSETGILFDMMPEEFTRDQLKQKMTEQNVMTRIREVVYRWNKDGLIEILENGRLKKITNDSDSSSNKKKKKQAS
jgi:hypothetical protein